MFVEYRHPNAVFPEYPLMYLHGYVVKTDTNTVTSVNEMTVGLLK